MSDLNVKEQLWKKKLFQECNQYKVNKNPQQYQSFTAGIYNYTKRPKPSTTGKEKEKKKEFHDNYVTSAHIVSSQHDRASTNETNRKQCNYFVLQHQAAAFLNMRSQGEGVRDALKSLGAQDHCQHKVPRSGWGITARCLPSLEQSPAMPCGEPLGFKGYSSVGRPWSSR